MDSPLLMSFFRTLIFYFTLVAAVRLMGKREIASLAPTDLVVAILLADMAIIPIEQPDTPILMGLVPIVTIVALQILLSYTSLKNLEFQKVIDGVPSVLIRSGKIDLKALTANRYALEELVSQVRLKGIHDIADVEVAILESNGELSVIPKSQKRPVTPADLGIETRYEGLPHILILDGQVLKRELEEIKLDEAWLNKELKRLGVEGGPESVLFASINTEGELYFQVREE